MNAKLEWLFRRRSIRQYGRGTVTDIQVRDMLEAAMAAPSACAKDPWRFVVVRSPAVLNRIADGLPNGQMLRHAQVGIVVCGDQEEAHDKQLSFCLQDCGAAIENLEVHLSDPTRPDFPVTLTNLCGRLSPSEKGREVGQFLATTLNCGATCPTAWGIITKKHP